MPTTAAGTVFSFDGASLGIVQSVRDAESGAELDITDIGEVLCKLHEAGLSEITIDVTVKGEGAASKGDTGEIIIIPAHREALKAATADAGTNVITSVAHGYANADRVRFVTDGVAGVLPLPLRPSAVYHVRDKTDDTLKVAATAGGAAVNLTTDGTATWYVYRGGTEISLPAVFVCMSVSKSGESGGQITTD
jgi:hypothetical protein